MDEPYVKVTWTAYVRGRAVTDAAIKSRRGPDATVHGLIELVRHYENPNSTEQVEFTESHVST